MIVATSKDGIKLQGDLSQKTFQLLEATDLNWTVNKIPLITADGLQTESSGIFRNDTNKWLGTVGKQYTPYQNHELATNIIKASEEIGDSFRGGYLKDGDKVFFQIGLKDEYVGSDTIKRFITHTNSHDGTTSIGFGSSNTVVVCQNTFYKAYREINKVRHFSTAQSTIQQLIVQLRSTVLHDELLMQNYKRMAETKTTNQMFDRIIKVLFKDVEGGTIADISTRKKNQMNQFAGVLESELESHGNSAWGLFNAVTYYANHITSKEESKDNSIMFGSGYKIMNNSFEAIMDFINEHTAELVPVA